jgi:hypothetical protein
LRTENEVSSVRKQESSLVVNVISVELLKFVEHGRNVNDNTITKDIDTLVVENSAWEKMESVFALVDDDGVA